MEPSRSGLILGLLPNAELDDAARSGHLGSQGEMEDNNNHSVQKPRREMRAERENTRGYYLCIHPSTRDSVIRVTLLRCGGSERDE